jgi:hypothetical protein
MPLPRRGSSHTVQCNLVVSVGRSHEQDQKSALSAGDGDDLNDRETIPQPKRAKSDELVTEQPKGDLLDQVLSQMGPALRDGDSNEAPARREGGSPASHEADTWRPPPPATQQPSSLAPRERPVAASTQSDKPKTSAALLRVAAIFALCVGAFWLRGQLDRRGPTVADEDVEELAPHAAVAPPAAPEPQAPVVQAPVEPAAPSVAVPEPAAPDEGKAVPSLGKGDALGAPRAKRARHAAIDISHLPDEPSRQDVIAGLNQLRGELSECSKGRSGTAEIDLTIASSGSVTYALIAGDYAGTPQGSCIARTIRGAHFEPFTKPRVRVLYRMAL